MIWNWKFAFHVIFGVTSRGQCHIKNVSVFKPLFLFFLNFIYCQISYQLSWSYALNKNILINQYSAQIEKNNRNLFIWAYFWAVPPTCRSIKGQMRLTSYISHTYSQGRGKHDYMCLNERLLNPRDQTWLLF